MPLSDQASRLRFESFELDLRTSELRKDGRVVKLQDQPFKLLALLASRPGELVTRVEIEKALWGDGEFVEFEHGINTAMRKIREALGDDLEKPRFIETLPRKGYRFLAAVESVGTPGGVGPSPAEAGPPARSFRDKIPLRGSEPSSPPAIRAESPQPEPAGPPPGSNSISAEEFFMARPVARSLFLLIQAGYLAMYCGALYRAEALEEVLSGVLPDSAGVVAPVILVLAAGGIAVRLYLLSAVGLDHPEAGVKFQQLFPFLFILDALWAASPLLLAQAIGLGLALGSVAALAYLPFAQRTLMLSAGRNPKHAS
ncbi:MAG: winged helix-turn-helix domain-containing protein [Terriglobia bacterium]